MQKNKNWWKASLLRVAKTVIETALATISTQLASIGYVNVELVIISSLLAGLLCFITAMGGLPEVEYKNLLDECLKCINELHSSIHINNNNNQI